MDVLTKRIIHFCYYLEESKGYRRTKSFFYDLLEHTQSPLRPYFDVFMIALVLSTVLLLVHDVKHPPGHPLHVFEVAATLIFVVEYLLRAWIYNSAHAIVIEHYERAEFLNTRFRLRLALQEMLSSKLAYATQPLAIIDLLAILPSYRPFRILRIFLLFRLFKLFRYARSVHEFAKVLAEKRFELYTLGIFIGFVVFAASTAIYMFEGGREGTHIHNFFDAVYWSLVTISTVGYGDIVPISTEGRLITLVLIVSGIGVISFSTSIIVSAFAEKLRGLQESQVFSEIERGRDYTVVCSYGRVGAMVVRKLAQEKGRLVIVDQDPDAAERARSDGYLAVQGNAADNALLENLRIRDRVKTILCITGDDVTNVFITLSTRHMNKELQIISRANSRESVKKLYLAGANHVITPFEGVGHAAAEYIHQPVAFDVLYQILSGERRVRIETIRVLPDSFAENRRLQEIKFLQFRLVLLGVVSEAADSGGREEGSFSMGSRCFHFNPPSAFVVRTDDVLVVFGHEYSVRHFRDEMEKSTLKSGAA